MTEVQLFWWLLLFTMPVIITDCFMKQILESTVALSHRMNLITMLYPGNQLMAMNDLNMIHIRDMFCKIIKLPINTKKNVKNDSKMNPRIVSY